MGQHSDAKNNDGPILMKAPMEPRVRLLVGYQDHPIWEPCIDQVSLDVDYAFGLLSADILTK